MFRGVIGLAAVDLSRLFLGDKIDREPAPTVYIVE